VQDKDDSKVFRHSRKRLLGRTSREDRRSGMKEVEKRKEKKRCLKEVFMHLYSNWALLKTKAGGVSW
jgi:hypothetical protein